MRDRIFCPNCGREMDLTAITYCPYCGAKIRIYDRDNTTAGKMRDIK